LLTHTELGFLVVVEAAVSLYEDAAVLGELWHRQSMGEKA